MDWLLQNPNKAETIVNNNMGAFHEHYLTQAAESCYWRALYEGWGEASNMTGTSGPVYKRGLQYESFLLLDSKDMMQFSFVYR